MIIIRRFLLLASIVVLVISSLSAQESLVLNDGDRVCFIGNSITHDGQYHKFLHMYHATRFPDIEVAFFNCGVAGDVADGMISRLEEDILSNQPGFAFIMTGMNDVNRILYSREEASAEQVVNQQEALDNYYNKTEKLVNLLIENGVESIFLTPSIYDQTADLERENNFGTNDALAKCAVHIRSLAEKHKAPVIDFFKLMNELNNQIQKDDLTKTIVGPDRIHPGTTGHFIMFSEIVKTLFPNENVSLTVLDARKRKVIASDNCTVVLNSNSSNLEYKIREMALPFPVSDELREALKLVPFQSESNREILQIKKLKKGSYNLFIDDIKISTFSSEELKEGVNLANFIETPQFKQAQRVAALCQEYHDIQNQLRTIAFVEYRMLNKYEGAKTLAGKKAYLDAELEKQIGKSYYNWNVKTCNSYFEYLPDKEKIINQLNLIRGKIYTVNKPEWHSCELKKMM